MVQQIISEIADGIVPILITAFVAVLTVVFKSIGSAIVALLERKREAIIAKIGADTYDHNLAVARSVWGAVDEEARTNPQIQQLVGDITARIKAKQELFATKIQQAIPGITDDEIEQLRQAVAGEVNKGREVLTAPAASTAQPESGAVASDTTGAV